jgi:hypothetical protein
MLMNRPLVSFCIPTNGRVEILKKTLESFFIDNIDVDISLYEICIADNSSTDETEYMLQTFFQGRNIIYKRNNAEGYLNSVEALKIGTGIFLKLHNNYTLINKGFLTGFINRIKSHINTKPFLFFTFGNIKNKEDQDVKVVNDFNAFLAGISYWSTWSTAFGIWKDDFDNMYGQIKINNMFPHTSFLFDSHFKSEFIIDNQLYFENQSLEKKGGYHITKTFCVDYIEMLHTIFEENLITARVYKSIKNNLLYDFFTQWYIDIIIHKDKFTFDISNTFGYLCIYYKKIEILFFYILFGIYFFRRIIKKCILFIGIIR